MNIIVHQLIEGAKKATGLTVIIDVFRAFSTACYVFGNGTEKIIPVGDLETTCRLKKENPNFILIGERDGKKQPGFDYGNSPSEIENIKFSGKTVVQTTSAGTQGLVNARNAEEIITGSFVNAGAVVEHIRGRQPETVSLVAMGKSGVEEAMEDTMCADYIRSLLVEQPLDFNKIYDDLRSGCAGKEFFDPNCDWMPESDFDLCLNLDRFHFVLKANELTEGLISLYKM